MIVKRYSDDERNFIYAKLQQIRGAIITMWIEKETTLDVFLARYIVGKIRDDDWILKVFLMDPNCSFGFKLKMLIHTGILGNENSDVIQKIRKLSKIRNIVAHSYHELRYDNDKQRVLYFYDADKKRMIEADKLVDEFIQISDLLHDPLSKVADIITAKDGAWRGHIWDHSKLVGKN